jgi:2-polyprenyl-3-methyl-5-hydroxy-6-metoxy-1,4-benzoquinol methylase
MIENFIGEIRLFQILHEDIDFHNDEVKVLLLQYINKYIKYKQITSQEFKLNYENFLRQYSKDSKKYIESNIYPAIKNGITYTISREEYDVFLLLSTILTQHRYNIMCEIYSHKIKNNSALIIGSGVGIELELIKETYKEIDAYDITIDKFCNKNHTNINFYEKEFIGESEKLYNDIYIVELLEHVSTPYDLINKAKKTMKINGRIIITLAVNIPQFDHIVNFNDINLFLEKINNLNLYVSYQKDINHNYLMNGLKDSRNIFMILEPKK